ncbi:hypothetical protein Oter_4140 [Opitutus terrae PB90-1]|uniref:Uncharacterized protein n=2 Tax=Opitutus terrae TaxID=107709 RepID=B2A078_OPITP|nr:hypothetical protein Oter_4140 [Opitutus terrae PB90-1]
MHGDMPLKLSQLLVARQGLLQGAQLANLALAFHLLQEFATRIQRARLTGLVCLQSPEATEDGGWAELTALEGNQSLIEEHFTDEDLMDLADTVAYVTEADVVSVKFRIEQFYETFVAPLRAGLEQAGIAIDIAASGVEQDAPSDLPQKQ